MKTKIFVTVLFCFFSLHQSLLASTSSTWGGDPDVKVVVSQKRIWLVADEISVKNLAVQVQNEKGKVVMEKQFSSKMADWSLRIDALPEGKYSVVVAGKKMTQFER